jgi:hypothetical protein
MGDKMAMNSELENGGNAVRVLPGAEFRIALVLAILADALQLALLPMFVEGAASPAADVIDVAMAGILYFLLGWHWEFLPSFAAKLIPGVDMVPLWTLAVANVYRKSKRELVAGAPNTSAS